MVPWFAIDPGWYGAFVFVAAWLALRGATRAGAQFGVAARHFARVTPFGVALGIAGGYAWHALAYAGSEPAVVTEAALGHGILGAIAGAWLAIQVYARLARVDLGAFAGAWFYALPTAQAAGRVGCFLVHDHPGRVTDSALGVRWPDGIVRHDLGLLEALACGVLAILFRTALARGVGPRGFVILWMLGYGSLRIALDPLRVGEPRQLGWTPSQWAGAGLVGIGVVMAARRYQPRT